MKVVVLLPNDLRQKVLLLFVDQGEEHEASFWPSSRKLPVRPQQLQFINARVLDTCVSDRVSVYVFSAHAERDFGVPQQVYQTWLGSTREQLLATLVAYADSAEMEPSTKGKWLAFSGAGNHSFYVQELRVPCLTPSALLAKAGVTVDRLVTAVIDTKQSESTVNGFLDLAHFQPGIFMFKLGVWDTASAQAIFGKLGTLGLEVGRIYTGDIGSATDGGVAIPLANTPPQFSGCDIPRACGPVASRWSYLQDCLRNAASSAQDVVSRGGRPTIVHIGSAGLGAPRLFTDVDLHHRALMLMPQSVRKAARVVLVDAGAVNEGLVSENVGVLPIQRSRQSQFVNAMITDGCNSSYTSMFRFGPETERDFGVPFGMVQTWLGPVRKYPLDVLGGYTDTVAAGSPDFPKWSKFKNAWNASAYVTELRVPCLSVGALLDRVGARAEDVAMVVIDGERSDIAITNSFLQLPHWRPGFLQYELATWEDQENLELVQRLRQRGLEVGRTYGESLGQSDANNVIAVPVATAPPEGLLEPEFSVCKSTVPCRPQGQKWYFFGDILQSVVQTAVGKVAKQQHPVFLQIGSASLVVPQVSHEDFVGLDTFRKALRKMPPWLQAKIHFVHVDSNAVFEEQARTVIQQQLVSADRTHFVNAKVDGLCIQPGQVLTYYRISQQAEQDFGVPWHITWHWLRQNPDSLLGSFKSYVAQEAPNDRYQINWKALAAAGNVSKYMEEVRVPCMSIDRVLEKAGVAAENVVMVVVDAHNTDVTAVESVERMLNLPGFTPGFLMEGLSQSPWNGSWQQYNVQLLKRLGFRVGMTSEGTSSLIAIPDRHEPQFSACDLPGPCGPAGSRWFYLQDLLSPAATSAREKHLRNVVPVLLQIGCDGFVSAERFTDVDLWTRTLGLLSVELLQSVRIVFVDPNADHQDSLWENFKKVPLARTQAQFVNGMVTDVCKADSATMYRPSRDAERDFGVPYSVYQTWLGPTPNHSLDVLRAMATSTRYDRDKWQRFHDAPNRSSYITSVEVPCLTPSALLAKARTTADHLAMVVIDAEGADNSIVSSMLDLPDFRPGFLQWELLRFESPEHQALFTKLQSRGFEVGRTYPTADGGSDALNAVAVLH